jgi:diguanylate cyclase (GGDEF)-like protein/PAS domain S-box-containing protein
MKFGLHFKATQFEQNLFWNDTRDSLLQPVRLISLFVVALLIIFAFEDWFSVEHLLANILIAKLISVISLLMVFCMTYTRTGRKYAEGVYLAGFAIVMVTVSYQAVLLNEDFMVPIAVIMGSVVSAILIPWQIRYQIIFIILCFITMLATVSMLKGFPPNLPLEREIIASIVFSISTFFLAIYSIDRRFEFWLAESALRESEEQFRHVAEHSNDIIWIWSPDLKVQYISPAYETYTGNSSENIYKNPFQVFKIVHPDDRADFRKALEEILKGESRRMDFRVRHKDGTVYHLESWGSAIRDHKGEVVRCIGIWHDFTDRINHIRELDKIAVTDPLTQIYNRRYFYKRAQEEIDRARRSGNPFSLIIFDIDLFKNVNDTYGHIIGDKVLVELAQICQAELRNQDIFARYGGEEFIILLPETDIEAALIFAERLRESIANKIFKFDDITLTTSISLGISIWNNTGQLDLDAIFNQADQALYKSKEAGRNRVTVWRG